MRQPETILPNGTRVRTHAELESTRGMMVHPAHLSARRPGAEGAIAGVVGGHGGDVYYVEHAPGEPWAAYCFTEFELRAESAEALEAHCDTPLPAGHPGHPVTCRRHCCSPAPR